MDKEAIKNELLGFERKYWQAIKDNDAVTAGDLSDETCIVAGPNGVGSLTRESLERMMREANYRLNDFKIDDDAMVQMISDDVALIAYKVHENVTVDGQSLSLDAAEASTWVKKNGKWVCAMHSESFLGDAFGRDRH